MRASNIGPVPIEFNVMDVYAVVVVGVMMLIVIAQGRFFNAYLRVYGTDEDRRKGWSMWDWPTNIRNTVLRRPPWTISSLFRSVDDSLVERLRVQSLVTFVAFLALFLAAPTVDAWSGSYTVLGLKEQGWLLLLVVLLGLLFVARAFVAPVIIRRRRAGLLTNRSAAWLYAGLLGLPYVVILALVAVASPEAVPVVLLLMALTLPVWIIAWVALYRGAP